MTLRIYMLISVLFVFVLGCSGDSMLDPGNQQEGFDTATLFQQALDRLQATHQFPGATAAYILPDGSTAVFATGLAGQRAKHPHETRKQNVGG